MSTFPNLKASCMKQGTTQQTRILCNYSFKDYLRALVRKFLKTQPLRPMNKWRGRQSASLHPNASSMHYTSNLRETSLNDWTFRIPGKCEDNTSKTTRTCNHSDRGSAKPHLIPPPPQDLGTINQSQWTLTGQGLLWETGEVKEEANPEETLLEWMILDLKGEYRVCASPVDNKDTSLAIALQNRNTPTHEWPSW